MQIELDKLQIDAVGNLKNGKILKGGVGSGKSRTAIAYFFLKVAGGSLKVNGAGEVKPFTNPMNLLIFTTAKKRDELDWDVEVAKFGITRNPEATFCGVTVKVESWNNITNYVDVENVFVIFDEQRLVGSGAWVKAFYKIAARNPWIVLSATPGDNWMDYIPVFVANGFYKNRTEFINRHVKYSYRGKFPKIEGYYEEGYLNKLRKKVIVDMPYRSHTKRHIRLVNVKHDVELLKRVMRDRWHVYEERPVRDISEVFALSRKIVNTHETRTDALITLQAKHPRLIVFYNFNYELELLRALAEELGITYAEWNGKKHEPVPETKSWFYFVQYTAGAEAWECITTDATVFYSLNYSYKINEQARGRIDRRNTPFKELYYYVLRSDSWIDRAIWRAIMAKESFNESAYKL